MNRNAEDGNGRIDASLPAEQAGRRDFVPAKRWTRTSPRKQGRQRGMDPPTPPSGTESTRAAFPCARTGDAPTDAAWRSPLGRDAHAPDPCEPPGGPDHWQFRISGRGDRERLARTIPGHRAGRQEAEPAARWHGDDRD